MSSTLKFYSSVTLPVLQSNCQLLLSLPVVNCVIIVSKINNFNGLLPNFIGRKPWYVSYSDPEAIDVPSAKVALTEGSPKLFVASIYGNK